jgi:hypothetical protein
MSSSIIHVTLSLWFGPPALYREHFTGARMRSSPVIYTVKLSELISVCIASFTNILFKGICPMKFRNTFLLTNNLKVYNSNQ